MNYPAEIEADWSQYIKLRESGLKKQANRALLDIVQKIENIGPEQFKVFLYSLCEDGLGKNYSSRIQHPIFVKCILPLLLKGFESGSATELVYLAKANQSGFGKEVYKATGGVSNRELLKKAISAGLFFVVFPLFSYYRWKDKDPKDYMLTKENLDKMRENQRDKKI